MDLGIDSLGRIELTLCLELALGASNSYDAIGIAARQALVELRLKKD
ncbi:MAG: hypothetical protein HQL23_07505 [Candidatus Omnitrophica bacterium]|nr:hypothetical protein [Candidatus Omnitrophota bacterium]